MQLIATYYNTRRTKVNTARRGQFTLGFMIIIIPITWFILSFVVAGAANQRGFSAFGWFLFSLSFSPLIAGFCLLLFPAKPTIDYQALAGAISKENEPRLVSVPSRSAIDPREAIDNDEPYRETGNQAPAAVLWIIFFILILMGVLIIAKFSQQQPGNTNETFSTPTSSTINYETVARSTCMDILKAFAEGRASAPLEAAIEFLGQQGELGTPVNRSSYLLTECRLREAQTVGKAINNLIDQKRSGHLPQIPIGGATSDAYNRAVWVPFEKWIRHQGSRPNL